MEEKNNLSVSLNDYRGTSLEKSFIENDLEKAVYKDNEENRRLKRVGQEYGRGKGKQEQPTERESGAKEESGGISEQTQELIDNFKEIGVEVTVDRGNKEAPIQELKTPTNQSDKFYHNLDKIIERGNLSGVKKSYYDKPKGKSLKKGGTGDKEGSKSDDQSSDFTVGDTVKISAGIQSDPAGMKGETVEVTKIDGDILHVKNSEGKTGMYMDNTVEKVESKETTQSKSDDTDTEMDKLVDSKSDLDRMTAAEQGYGLEKLVNDKEWLVRREVAKHGYGLDKLVKDKIWSVREEVAKQGYGLDKLVSDEHWRVRAEVARQGHGLDKLMDDEHYGVRREIAKQGYGLDKLVDDKVWDVRLEVAKQGYGLDKLVSDSKEEVRNAAKEAIEKQLNKSLDSFDTPEVITGTNSQYYDQFNKQVCDAPIGSIAKGAGYVYKKEGEDCWVSTEDEKLRDIDITRTIGGFEDSCIVYPNMPRD